MKQELQQLIANTLKELNINEEVSFVIERPGDMAHGDYATNVALVLAPRLKKSPLNVAIEITEKLKSKFVLADAAVANDIISKIKSFEVAGPGFINISLKEIVQKEEVFEIISKQDSYGKHASLAGKKIVFEYTDPNPFKVFHIGHLMANTVGETLSRIAAFNGADIKRYCYQGDVGRHVALTIWGLRFMKDEMPDDSATVSDKIAYFGKAYALGATEYKKVEDKAKASGELDENNRPTSADFREVDEEVQLINKKIYDRNDEDINRLYDIGKEWSLEHFEEIYEILGTKFDRYFFESQSTPVGIKIVHEHTAPNGKSVFEESDGAIIFPGEKYGLHTRVFITKNGLPTYEGKEIGLMPLKYESDPYDQAYTITANEQDEYFKVVLKAAEFIFPEIASKTKHVSHGMLRLTTGKMSSRTGDVITGESLLKSMIDMSLEKMKEREMSEDEKKKAAEAVAVAAIKYTILRQATNKDTIFDPEKSLSFEGDSGPYLQYSYVRAHSILEKAKKENIEPAKNIQASGVAVVSASDGLPVTQSVAFENTDKPESSEDQVISPHQKLEKLLMRFPETTERAWAELAPHHIANYLMELAGAFNAFYANTQIVNATDPGSSYKVTLVKAFSIVMKNGLDTLGIHAPERM